MGNLLLEGMTMRKLMFTALAAGLLLTGGSVAWANDVVRLGGPPAQTEIHSGTDTELVRGGGHGGSHGGYHGGHYGHGYHGGYYGRGYYGGYYSRGYYGGYYARSYYPYYRPYYYGAYYYPSVYYTPYYSSYYYYPVASVAPVATVQTNGYYQAPAPSYVPPMPPADGNGTFPYDGGPRAPIPMPNPGQDLNPAKDPRGIIPFDGKLISLPTETTGDVPAVILPTLTRGTPISNTPAPARVAYPAYGDEPIAPAPRKTR